MNLRALVLVAAMAAALVSLKTRYCTLRAGGGGWLVGSIHLCAPMSCRLRGWVRGKLGLVYKAFL